MSSRVDVIADAAGKEQLLKLLRTEYTQLLDIAAGLDDAGWNKQSPCDEWEVRDVVGHMLDVAESYLGYFALADRAWEVGEPLGWPAYGPALSTAALGYRRLPRTEVLARLAALSEPLMQWLESLSAEEWTTKLVPHRYGGPLPAFVLAVFQLIDYAVHSWDVREATGAGGGIDYETSNLLVPHALSVYGFLLDHEKAAGQSISLQYDVVHPDQSVEPWTVAIDNGALVVAPGAHENPDVVLRLTPTELLLRVFRQLPCESSGDETAVARFEALLGTV